MINKSGTVTVIVENENKATEKTVVYLNSNVDDNGNASLSFNIADRELFLTNKEKVKEDIVTFINNFYEML